MSAPTCPKCAERGERRQITEGMSTQHAVMVGSAPFYDEGGQRHDHGGSAGGSTSYSCACGHRWSESYGSTTWPCPVEGCSYGKGA